MKQVKSICQSCLGGICDLSIFRQPCIRKTRAALASSHDLSAGDRTLRYCIGVGRNGFTWSGTERISRMSKWPDWHPPKEMIAR